MRGSVNEVLLRGRVSGDPSARELPSGDQVVSVRLVVERQESSGRSRQRVDVIDCAAWSARSRRSVLAWAPGDEVEVSGALRRRFYRAGGATASRAEVEIRTARRIGRRRSA